MAIRIRSRDIRGKMVLLGTGTSVGVPVIGCDCPVCRSDHPRNHRFRCAVAVGLPEGVLLVDTPPDLRSQLIRADLGVVHAVAFTHEHADHLYGLDELRLFQFYLGAPVPLYCQKHVEERIRHVFDYAFSEVTPTHPGATPRLEFTTIDDNQPFDVLGQRIIPIRLHHGPRFEVLGFRIGDVAYCTDTNRIPEESVEKLQDLDVLVLDALRHKPHATHFSLDEAVAMAQELGAKKTYLTHVSHELDYETTNAALPDGVELAYDGLEIDVPS